MREFESLPQSQVEEALTLAKASFPRFGNWEYCNQEDHDHSHFCLWGEYRHGMEYEDPCFFVTLDRWEGAWRAHLTVGQHSFMWTSADFGDAQLLSTQGHAQATEAMEALKQEIARLFSVFTSGPVTTVWHLWRMGDDGNAALVTSFATADEAILAMHNFEARGHKQTYWVAEKLQ